MTLGMFSAIFPDMYIRACLNICIAAILLMEMPHGTTERFYMLIVSNAYIFSSLNTTSHMACVCLTIISYSSSTRLSGNHRSSLTLMIWIKMSSRRPL